jgi:hypothetical protein
VRFEGERSKYSRYARASHSQSKRLIIYAVLLVGVIAAMIALRSKSGRIEWLPSFEEATEQAKAQNKPIMLYFFDANDEACARMENVTFADPAVRAQAAEFVCVRVSREAEPKLAERYYAIECPAVAFIAPDGKLISTMLNEREPGAFLDEMQQALRSRTPSPGREGTPDDEQLVESPGLAPRNAGPSRGDVK